MAKIYQFPNMKDKNALEQQMDVLQETMKEMYDSIRKVEMGYRMLQDQIEKLEDTYQEVVQDYALLVGSKNVADKWLEYCTFVGMERDPQTGEVQIYFKPEEMNEGKDDNE